MHAEGTESALDRVTDAILGEMRVDLVDLEAVFDLAAAAIATEGPERDDFDELSGILDEYSHGCHATASPMFALGSVWGALRMIPALEGVRR